MPARELVNLERSFLLLLAGQRPSDSHTRCPPVEDRSKSGLASCQKLQVADDQSSWRSPACSVEVGYSVVRLWLSATGREEMGSRKLKQRKLQVASLKKDNNNKTNGADFPSDQMATQRSPPPPTADVGALSLCLYLVKVVILSALSTPFWILTPLLSVFYGRPPRMVTFGQAGRFMGYVIRSKHLSKGEQLNLILTVIRHTATSPVAGCCWLIDEVLYSSKMNRLTLTQPLFVMSAYRSASTQMARLLAQDKQFVWPSAIMCAFPYLWVWKIVAYIFSDSGITAEEANNYLNKNFPKEARERHENDHFSLDTLDGYFLSAHLNGLAFQIGPAVIIKECHSAVVEDWNQFLMQTQFTDFVDRLARKTLLFRGASDVHRILLKGHFLWAASTLQMRYPDARFLSVLRDPLDRLQSGINHMAANPTLWQGQAPRWDWLADSYEQIESDYCTKEIEWYGEERRGRLALQFTTFIGNAEDAMKIVYRDLLVSNNMPQFRHQPKTSRRYTVDRSLTELNIDRDRLKLQLGDYYAWMKKQK